MKFFALLLSTAIFSTASFAKSDAVILDVRTQDEWNEKHLEGATLIDFKQADFKDKISKLDKTKNYEVYCRSGNRSGSAVKIMKEMGFTSVKNAGSLEEATKSLKGTCVGPACLAK